MCISESLPYLVRNNMKMMMLFDVFFLVSLKGEHLSLKGEHTGVCVLSLQGKMSGLQGTGEGRTPPVSSPTRAVGIQAMNAFCNF